VIFSEHSVHHLHSNNYTM